MLKKRLFILIILLLITKLGVCQFLEGYATSNYAGINGVNFNPASVVDSRIRLDINFFTVRFTGYNSYLNVNQPQINIPQKRFWCTSRTVLRLLLLRFFTTPQYEKVLMFLIKY